MRGCQFESTAGNTNTVKAILMYAKENNFGYIYMVTRV